MLTIARKKKLKASKKAQLRIELAKDVLKQLKLKRIEAWTSYFSLSHLDQDTARSLQWNKGFKEQFESKAIKTCRVCARGALMVSWVRKFNKYTLDEMNALPNRNPPLEEITKLFGTRNTLLIEDVFEDCFSPGELKLTEIENDIKQGLLTAKQGRVLKFAVGCKTREQVLARIMKNIIKNNGVFILPK
jgi:hypothetical protein